MHKNLLGIACVVVVHAILIRFLSGSNIVAELLAPGDHMSKVTVSLALLFLFMRMVLYLIVPGILCCYAGTYAIDHFKASRKPDSD